MIYDFCEKLLKDLQQERSNLVDAVVKGFHDFNTYKFACGKISGLELASQLIKERLKQEIENGN